MKRPPELSKHRPAPALHGILTRWYERELAWREEGRLAEPAPEGLAGDALDIASSTAEREMCASLGTRRHLRLKALGAAFERLQQGLYGICEECGEGIRLERLEVLPFATNCVDCQTEQETKVRRTLGDHHWAAPLKIDQLVETGLSIEATDSAPDMGPQPAADAKPFAPDRSIAKSVNRGARHSVGIRRGRLATRRVDIAG
ncbi:MAG TPA: TraR/DksA family transcriptional regulator [Terriglobales bacterium]|nr:TraR/DksA family transcriptional regulator [Terriglobales bacterium]